MADLTTKFALGARLFLAIVFAVAGLSKALHPLEFYRFLDEIKLVESGWVVPAGQLVIAAEIALAVFLLFGRYAKQSVTIAIVALGSFTIFQFLVPQLAGNASSCGCFNVKFLAEYEQSFGFRLARNALLLGIAFAVVIVERRSVAPQRSAPTLN